jgi:hypothetical protein
LRDYLEALALTVAIEWPIYAVLLARHRRAPTPSWWHGLAVNLVSHPLAFLVLDPLFEPVLHGGPELAVLELLVWAGEAVGLRMLGASAEVAVAASAVANVSSLVIGTALLG